MVWIVGPVCLLLLGIFLSPEALTSIGALQASLESENERIRYFALLEIQAARAVCLAGSFLMLLTAMFWQRLSTSAFISNILAHEADRPREQMSLAAFANSSFLIMAIVAGVGALYVVIGQELLGDSITRIINKEDGVIQQLTVYAFLFAAFLAAYLAWKQPAKSKQIIPMLFAFTFFVCAGEEISWGQRIFDLETPESIKMLNVQGQTNLHTMLGHAPTHAFFFIVLLYGTLLPVLASFYPLIHKLCSRLGLPVASLGLAAGFLFTAVLNDWLLYGVFSPKVKIPLRIEELRELLSSVGFALLMWESIRVATRNLDPAGKPRR